MGTTASIPSATAARPTPARRRLSQDERSAQILECARRLFSRLHPEAVSVEEVAREAGVTPGLVHHYFGTKRELYLAVVREMLRGGEPPVPEPTPGMTVVQRLDESVDRWLDRVERNRETWLAALGAQGFGRDREVERLLEKVSESSVDNLIELLDTGPAAEAPAALRALLRGYGGFAEAVSRQWLEHGRLTRDQTRTLLVASLLRLVEDVLPLLSLDQ